MTVLPQPRTLRDETRKPLLAGEDARAARSAAERVGEALLRAPEDRAVGAGLASGRIGSAVVLAHLARILDRPEWLDAARADLEAAWEGLVETGLRSGLYSGFAGIAWGSAHLERNFWPEDESDYEELDDALVVRLRSPGRQDYDLISGWVGLGAYALERWPHARAQELVELVLQRLRTSAEARDGGTTWKTDAELLAPHQRLRAPNGYYNLGLGHGVPGVIAFLSQLQLRGALAASDLAMLECAVEWIRAQAERDHAGMRYRSWSTDPPTSDSGSRLGWCYGDLGVAVALISAGRACAIDAWTNEGIALTKRALQVDERSQAVRDHGLCHGYAGVAHILRRLSSITHDLELAEQARAWFGRTLERRIDGGIEGFACWQAATTIGIPERDWVYGYVRDPGYLMGAGGVALALASATDPDESSWDQPLLLAFPEGV